MRNSISIFALLALPVAAQDRIVPSDSGLDGFARTIPMRDGKSLAADVYKPMDA